MRRVTARVRDAVLPIAGRMRRTDWPATDDTVLILQPDHLGDILLSQPAVQLIRELNPESHLIAVVGPWSRETVSMSWPVDEIITISFPGFTRFEGGSPTAAYWQLRTESRRLTQLRARSAYVLRPDAWWAAWLASLVAPEVVTANDPRAARFATQTADVEDNEHASIRSFQVATAGSPAALPTWMSSPLTLQQSLTAAAEADDLLQLVFGPEPYLIVHPGSGARVKEWPAQRWRAVVAELSRDGYRVVLTGSEAEAGLCAEISSDSSSCDSLAGQTPLPVLAELLRSATIVLGPDCGPLHLAVATGTPTVHLF